MKLVILAVALCICATSASRFVLPRLPLSLLLRGNVPLIDLDNRIVGGTVVKENSLPFQVSIQRQGALGGYSQSCGGSILNKTHVLSAAHCAYTPITNVRVVAGEHDLKVDSGLEQERGALHWVQHPNYDSNKISNDYSVLELDKAFDLSVPSAKPIGLPEKCTGEPDLSSKTLTVSGWGTTSSGGAISDQLRKVDVPYVTQADCKVAYGSTEIDDSMICAGKSGVDSCQGDSGGPLFIGEGASAVQHGIVSWGRGCAQAGFPGVYSSVCYGLDFITGGVNKP